MPNDRGLPWSRPVQGKACRPAGDLHHHTHASLVDIVAHWLPLAAMAVVFGVVVPVGAATPIHTSRPVATSASRFRSTDCRWSADETRM